MSANIKQAKMRTYAGGSAMPGAGTSMRPIPQGMQMGDPGFFGTLWGGIKGAVGGLVTGGPIGMVGGAVKGALSQGASVTTASPQLPPMMTMPTLVQAQNGVRPPSVLTVGGMAPGGPRPSISFGPQEAGMGGAYQAGKASSPGYHWNKSGYFLKDGTWIEKGTRQVKNRRRNPLNPRALDRSMSRITSAKRASKKLGRITIRKAASCR